MGKERPAGSTNGCKLALLAQTVTLQNTGEGVSHGALPLTYPADFRSLSLPEGRLG